jgi:pyrroline-5-carboxylate reductase
LSILASQTIGFIGAGNMAEALIRGLVRGGHVPATRITASGPRRERLDELAWSYGVAITTDNRELARSAGLVVLSVKPQILDKVLREVGAELQPGTLVVSIAAGVDTAAIEAVVAEGVRVVRAMPNTPALVGIGASAIAGGTHAGVDHLDLAERLLGVVGIVERVAEPMLDAVTGLSGSGPAYVFLLAEAMIEAGVLVGFPRDVASRLVVQTLLGSATLLAQDPAGPAELRAAVTSPGGTTAAGLRELEVHGLRAAVLDAVSAATRRSRELGAG